MPRALAISAAPEALRLHLGAFCNLPRAASRLGAYDHLRVAAKSNSTAAGPRSLSRLSRRMDVDQAFDEIGAGCDVVVTPPTYFRPWLQPSATLRTESACDYRVGWPISAARYRTGPRSASTARTLALHSGLLDLQVSPTNPTASWAQLPDRPWTSLRAPVAHLNWPGSRKPSRSGTRMKGPATSESVPLAAVTLDRVTTAAIEGAADQMWS